jgi:hypothetical protein
LQYGSDRYDADEFPQIYDYPLSAVHFNVTHGLGSTPGCIKRVYFTVVHL